MRRKVMDNDCAMFMCIAPFVFVKVSVYPVTFPMSVMSLGHSTRPVLSWLGPGEPGAAQSCSDIQTVCGMGTGALLKYPYS
ncbi:hypothetical protein Pmani_018142 [Petrolisthes manimaculis]|uniref:Uncharacterized protein n=1 Tax=Petrolisthes manimaculis TaxID=1843537 RepID=A0AAE1U947_9EUCA|nr:hypothetical protein Pmani_018142 [Petrolisthes manimaculis]